MKKTITVIDTFGFLFRSYYALPPLKSKSGFPTGLLTGFMNFIANIGKDFQTDYLVFALDSKGDTFRNEIYEQYKAHRPDVPEDLLKQLPVAIEWIEKMGFQTASKVGFEADDIIASIAYDAKQKDLEVRIVSHDKDLYQLIDDDTVYLFDPIKKVVVNEDKCFSKYGVMPKQFTDYQALLGDSADNVPGVKGVGAKTAEALIKEYGTLENIYENIENIEKARWKNLLDANKDMAFISKELVTLKIDCHAIDDVETFVLPKENPILKIADILSEYDLNRIIDRVNKDGLNYKTKIPKKKEKLVYDSILLDTKEKLFEVLDSIKDDSIVAFDTETTDLDTNRASIVGFSFCFEENKGYYVPIAHNYLGVSNQVSLEDSKKALEKLNGYKLVAQNFKYDYEIIRNNFDLEMNLFADTMIMSWLLNPGSKVGLDSKAKELFDHDMISFKDILKKGENFSNVQIQQACEYACEDALITFKLYNNLLDKFKTTNTYYLFELGQSLEFEFTKVLAYMQQNGIKLDISVLEELKQKNTKHIQELTVEIYELAQCEFNINSPKQLGEILFEKMGLKASKKTKSGYSTNEMVLNKLYNEHKIIPLLLNYREAYKLQSTYIEPLLELAKKSELNRIYTSFLQTGTATGRLSSKNPNLQNIPVKSEAGSLIRSAFIPKDGYSLVGIDYSQIELRLLAHFSKDEALVEAFRNGLDIHKQTAIKIFGEEEASKNRAIAKSINFGLIYGMGSRKLADTLGIQPKEAKTYIESYFKAFKSVKDYLKSIEDSILEEGFVETLLKRKRIFDFESANGMQKAAFLREGVNTKFQGSAADLIKLSMLKIWKKYKTNKDIKMLLQIHDELIFEIKNEKIEEISNDLVNIMENIVELNVPLKVSKNTGKSWQELK
ncbi:DNA polymerase I [Malaciobacter molluscorum LMG 25693]|uniref:DNA polymerase I n=1 Tax=Malaciobacter molluscorum LMG 25693 TaxID=870501 RepID=A0A2G1DIB4_9BACT|nr:DNA polymerase I [Malaciobacter molluscorum]AXX92370.1 DNA polymerase I, 5' -- 3' polymerase, 5' -- 3' and 3' -- 5' exonuclease [Malaciobacter molluscorum LMG 25693]PHO18180.1 DNA polymerase I [Malaciobacter molluscorum LMG 25693]